MPATDDERVRYWHRKLRNVIRKYSLRLGGWAGSGVRDELEQVALIAIWQNWRYCEEASGSEGDTLAKMTKVIENKMVDYMRHEFIKIGKRYRKSEEDLEDIVAVAGLEPPPDVSFDSSLRHRQLMRKVDQMPPMMRQIVHLLARGDSLKEACESVSPGYPQRPTAIRDKFRKLALEYLE